MCYNNKTEDFLDRLQRAIDNAGNIMILVEDLEEAFPELKERKDEKVRKALLGMVHDRNDLWIDYDIYKEEAIAWLEKQGEKKTTDKVKPKFNQGDWVIDKQGIVHQIANVIENMTTHIYGYDLVDGGYINNEAEGVRLRTIDDAKDGDVLVNDSNIFMFHFIIGTRVRGYCHVNTNDGRFYDDMPDTGCFGLINDIFTPATKEQRDLLFQKMTEAGYNFK